MGTLFGPSCSHSPAGRAWPLLDALHRRWFEQAPFDFAAAHILQRSLLGFESVHVDITSPTKQPGCIRPSRQADPLQEAMGLDRTRSCSCRAPTSTKVCPLPRWAIPAPGTTSQNRTCKWRTQPTATTFRWAASADSLLPLQKQISAQLEKCKVKQFVLRILANIT